MSEKTSIQKAFDTLLKRLSDVEVQLMEINAERANEDTVLMNLIRVAAFNKCLEGKNVHSDPGRLEACRQALRLADCYKRALDERNTL